MCKTLYKYFLLTATSFGTCGGLYLFCSVEWLWPYKIDYTIKGIDGYKWDWREVLYWSGLIGFIIFSPGIVIVIRLRAKELQYYGIFLLLPSVVTVVCLIIQLSTKLIIFDPADWCIFGLALGLLAVIVNLFLLVYEINTYGSHQLIPTAKCSDENAV